MPEPEIGMILKEYIDYLRKIVPNLSKMAHITTELLNCQLAQLLQSF